MIKNRFHVHSQHSLRDSVSDIKKMVAEYKKHGCEKLVLTDHGTLTGAEEFLDACKENEIDPVVGVEAYVAEEGEKRLHLILIPRDYIGYQAIMKAIAEANKRLQKTGVLIFPEMNKEILERNFGIGSKGYGHVIATSACIGGVIAGLSYRAIDAKENYEKIKNKLSEINLISDEIKANQENLLIDKKKLSEVKQDPEALKQLNFAIKAKSKKISELKKKLPETSKIEALKTKFEAAKKLNISEEDLINLMESETIRYMNLFGKDNFFIEIQYHGMFEEMKYFKILSQIADKHDIKVVISNDEHLILQSDWAAREMIKSSAFHQFEAATEADKELYIKSDEEIVNMVSQIIGKKKAEQALLNTREMLDSCHIDWNNSKHYPVFDKTQDSNELLKKICYENISYRYPNNWDQIKIDRLAHELNTICSMGFADYFLIVKDYIEFGRKLGYMPEARYSFLEKNIRNMTYQEIIVYVNEDQSYVGYSIGPGRGSGAGSIVCYLTGITDIDPISNGLLFERFLNPERVTMPDIDTDFANGVRDICIEYIFKKYGEQSVCRIVTEGTLAAKGSIKEIASILSKSPRLDEKEVLDCGEMLSGIIQNKPGESISLHEDEFKAICENNSIATTIINKAKLIEGTFVQYGMHAGGVVIADETPIIENVPLMWDSTNETWKCQCDMVKIEEKGFLKMDFLGLKNLNIITDTLREIYKATGRKIDVNRDILVEQEVIDSILKTGLTTEVFQLNSEGFMKVLKEFGPTSIEDVTMLLAIYRPGPMDSIPSICAVKNGRQPATYLTPQLKPILEQTYGCIVYQEQVQEICKSLAGYSLGRADNVRRFMSKKKMDKLAHEREDFVKGCELNGISSDISNAIFDQMIDFAKYAFNKSHAAAYARVTYITAWLKYHYTAIYMAVCMRYKTIEQIPALIEDCKNFGIQVLPIDINKTQSSFYAENGNIYFGISSIKGVNNTEAILNNRSTSFRSFADFLIRTRADKTIVEGLIKVGAFSSFCSNRKALLVAYNGSYSVLLKKLKDAEKKVVIANNIVNIIKNNDATAALVKINEIKKIKNLPTIEKAEADVTKYEEQIKEITESIHNVVLNNNIIEDDLQKLDDEKELLGVFVSGHPTDFYEAKEKYIEISETVEGEKATLYGIITDVKKVVTKKKQEEMAFVTLDTKYGSIQAVCFPKNYKEISSLLTINNCVTLTGKIVEESNSDDPDDTIKKMFVNNVKLADKKMKNLMIEVDSIMDWTDSVSERIKTYIVSNGYRLLIHDRLFNEIRTTNMIVDESVLSIVTGSVL